MNLADLFAWPVAVKLGSLLEQAADGQAPSRDHPARA